MNSLALLRHAKAVPQDTGEDRARPLSPKGERAMADLGAWVQAQGLAPALVLCSPAARTRQTFALLLPFLAGAPEIKYEEALYLADAAELMARLRRVPARHESVLVVGHNPGLHELALLLLHSGAGAKARRLRDAMPTGALASFALDGPWAALDRGAARLAEFVTPKELRD
jgi:phosphohistidine phosphatase